MTGVDLLVLAATGAAGLLLVLAGVGHVRHRALFAATLAAQRVLPAAAQGVVARAIGPVELFLGAVTLLAVAGPGPLRVGALATGLLYLALAGYVAFVWRARPSVPCGCFGSSAPASGWTVVRAVALGAASLMAVRAGVPSGVDLLVVAAGAAVLTGALWLLPELAHP